MSQKIIHCDADCFYAAIEMRDDPTLRHRPIAVGGSPSRRGVLTTCNYEARQYGVRSAMSSSQAMKLCPNLLIVPVRMKAYREASEIMRDIFLQYTDVIEPLSLDEAYLDVSESSLCNGSATHIAEDIRLKVYQQVGITVSAGVAPCKFLAKVASDWNKPNGLFVITPQTMDAFILQLPVEKIHGVGKVTKEKLHKLGIYSCLDIRHFGEAQLNKNLGVFGQRLFELAHGIDKRTVKSQRIRKSLSVERTFASDIQNGIDCIKKLPALFEEFTIRLAQLNNSYCVGGAFIKIKFNDFTSTTLERAGSRACIEDYTTLMYEGLTRSARPVRLLGLGVRFNHTVSNQLDLFTQ